MGSHDQGVSSKLVDRIADDIFGISTPNHSLNIYNIGVDDIEGFVDSFSSLHHWMYHVIPVFLHRRHYIFLRKHVSCMHNVQLGFSLASRYLYNYNIIMLIMYTHIQ